eukprot:UN16180
MAAVVGTIVHNNHIVFDGYLSPSNNLKFSDVPTGIRDTRQFLLLDLHRSLLSSLL